MCRRDGVHQQPIGLTVPARPAAYPTVGNGAPNGHVDMVRVTVQLEVLQHLHRTEEHGQRVRRILADEIKANVARALPAAQAMRRLARCAERRPSANAPAQRSRSLRRC